MNKKTPYEVKAVLSIDDAPNITQEKLYEIFFEALRNKKLNHFEITGGGFRSATDHWRKD